MTAWLTVWGISVLGTVYSYAIYPFLLCLLPTRTAQPSPEASRASRPRVTHIIACRNEQGRLRAKLENATAIAYENLETLVASDASDDASDDIVREFSARGVGLVRSHERRGKEHAQKLAVAAASGDILVFSDAGTSTPPDSFSMLVAVFDDPAIGAVSSEDSFLAEDGRLVGEGAYVRYEMWLRRQEARVNSLVGLSGSFSAVRRPVAELLDEQIPSDFACAINAYRLGFKAVSEPRVRGIYKDIKDPGREFDRKVRTALRGIAAVATIPEVLNPFRYGLFAFQVWSHKVLRWLVPWFMAGAVFSTIVLASDGGFFAYVLAAEAVVLATLLLAHLLPALRKNAFVRLLYYFFQANIALGVAAVRFLGGQRIVTWNPSVR